MLKFVYTIIIGVLLVAVATFSLAAFPDRGSVVGLDVIFHFLGGGFAAWCGYLISRKTSFVWLTVLVIGVGWELAELASSIFGPTYWPTIVVYYYSGGWADSLADLVVDVFGAGIFILLYCRYYGSN